VSAALARRGTGGAPLFLTSANGNVVSRYARDQEFRRQVDSADAIDADGQPLVVASRWMTRTPIPERAATTDLFHDVGARGAKHGLRIYLLGGTEEVNITASVVALQRHPGLVLAGRRDGYFSREEEDAVVARINAARPDILWVGLGVPFEHAFVMRNRHRLTGVGIIKTCGGLFDFIAGRHQRAPQWMQDHSLEWAYRVWREPQRLFWRYATTNVHALMLLALRTRDVTARG
jgi:exopolysaccharide biosynthesis WecB/TagA/CpsF family protein